ncbi:transposon Ty3-I Gag-Pol polyprotein [Trichonephila clavipes]|nr:transposon Ty3-I Gag-Pol polyprotein [Trichonephila clavipes]
MTIATLKDLLIGCENYDEELTKNIHSTIAEDRKAREKKQEEQKEKLRNAEQKENLRIEEREENLRIEEQKEKLRIEEREEKLRIEEREEKLRIEQLIILLFRTENRRKKEQERVTAESRLEFEKINLEKVKLKIELGKINLERAKLESQRDSNELQRTNPETKQTSIENFILSVRILTLPIPKKQEGWNLFFSSLERSFKTKNVPDEFKGEILLNLLGEKAEDILVYVKDEEISDYNKLKSLVLREFEPTPLICLQNIQKAKRMPNETHVQLASRLLTNWDQYCNLRNVNDFNSLKELIVSDKLYETLDNETAVHINIKQEQNWFKPIQMGKECDMFYACKGKSFSEFTHRACHNQNDSRKDFKGTETF